MVHLALLEKAIDQVTHHFHSDNTRQFLLPIFQKSLLHFINPERLAVEQVRYPFLRSFQPDGKDKAISSQTTEYANLPSILLRKDLDDVTMVACAKLLAHLLMLPNTRLFVSIFVDDNHLAYHYDDESNQLLRNILAFNVNALKGWNPESYLELLGKHHQRCQMLHEALEEILDDDVGTMSHIAAASLRWSNIPHLARTGALQSRLHKIPTEQILELGTTFGVRMQQAEGEEEAAKVVCDEIVRILQYPEIGYDQSLEYPYIATAPSFNLMDYYVRTGQFLENAILGFVTTFGEVVEASQQQQGNSFVSHRSVGEVGDVVIVSPSRELSEGFSVVTISQCTPVGASGALKYSYELDWTFVGHSFQQVQYVSIASQSVLSLLSKLRGKFLSNIAQSSQQQQGHFTKITLGQIGQRKECVVIQDNKEESIRLIETISGGSLIQVIGSVNSVAYNLHLAELAFKRIVVNRDTKQPNTKVLVLARTEASLLETTLALQNALQLQPYDCLTVGSSSEYDAISVALESDGTLGSMLRGMHNVEDHLDTLRIQAQVVGITYAGLVSGALDVIPLHCRSWGVVVMDDADHVPWCVSSLALQSTHTLFDQQCIVLSSTTSENSNAAGGIPGVPSIAACWRNQGALSASICISNDNPKATCSHIEIHESKQLFSDLLSKCVETHKDVAAIVVCCENEATRQYLQGAFQKQTSFSGNIEVVHLFDVLGVPNVPVIVVVDPSTPEIEQVLFRLARSHFYCVTTVANKKRGREE
eukprot:PhF_6_TR42753/c0_g1_i1/m.64642